MPALVIGPAITPFTFVTVKTVKEIVEPDDSQRNFKRKCKTRLRPKISLLYSCLNFALTSILVSIVVFFKAGDSTHWLIFGVAILVLCPILVIPFFKQMKKLEKNSDKLNKLCFQHTKKNCKICDAKFAFNHSKEFVDVECVLHDSRYPCKVCKAIQNTACSGPETEWRPAKQKMFSCRTCDVDQICQTCKRACHKDHEISFTGISSFVCNCNQRRDCSLFYCKKHPNFQLKCIACNFMGKKFCTRMSSLEEQDTKKDCYTCSTCGIFAKLCRSCRENCHKRHHTELAGKFKHRCPCGGKNNRSTDLCIFVCSNNHQHPFIAAPPTGCSACLLLDDCFADKKCTFLVTGEQPLDNHENCYQCEICGYEDVCKTCKELCHNHIDTSIDIEEVNEEEDNEEVEYGAMLRIEVPKEDKTKPRNWGADEYEYGYAAVDDFVQEPGFFCKCGAGKLPYACKALKKAHGHGKIVPVIQRNEHNQEDNEDVSANVTSEDEVYGDLEEDNYETIADENIYESLEEFEEFEEDYR